MKAYQVHIPAVQYRRPTGIRNKGVLTVSDISRERRENILAQVNVLTDLGIEITLEEMDGMVNVCLDDGDFDYAFQLYAKDSQLPEHVARLVESFDPADYRRARRAYQLSEVEN